MYACIYGQKMQLMRLEWSYVVCHKREYNTKLCTAAKIQLYLHLETEQFVPIVHKIDFPLLTSVGWNKEFRSVHCSQEQRWFGNQLHAECSKSRYDMRIQLCLCSTNAGIQHAECHALFTRVNMDCMRNWMMLCSLLMMVDVTLRKLMNGWKEGSESSFCLVPIHYKVIHIHIVLLELAFTDVVYVFYTCCSCMILCYIPPCFLAFNQNKTWKCFVSWPKEPKACKELSKTEVNTHTHTHHPLAYHYHNKICSDDTNCILMSFLTTFS